MNKVLFQVISMKAHCSLPFRGTICREVPFSLCDVDYFQIQNFFKLFLLIFAVWPTFHFSQLC